MATKFTVVSAWPLLFISLIFAQQSPVKPAGKGVIEGRVVSASTGEPLRKAQIILRNLDGRELPGTSTDSEGRFILKDIPPGRYRLRAERNGYIRGEYGARSPDRPGTILAVEAEDRLRDITFLLRPYAAITGRVVDEDREPLPNVEVYCLQYSYVMGKRRLMPTWGGATDDLGEFRIHGLAPGRYFLGVVYRPPRPSAANRSAGDSSPEESYAPTYYPGTNDPAAAVPIEVGPGVEVRGIELIPLRTPTVRVRGRVLHSLPQEGGKPTVILSPRDCGAGLFNTKTTSVRDREGSFEIAGVAPGSYIITAQLADGKTHYGARQPIEVGNSHIEGVELILTPGVNVSGRVRLDGNGTVRFEHLRVHLQSQDSHLNFSGDEVKRDGAFTLRNVAPGKYSVTVVGMPDEVYLRSVRIGNEDVMGTALNVGNGGASGQLDVVLGAGAGQVEGVVFDDQQNYRWATVVLVPGLGRRSQPYWYKTAPTDQYGRFVLSGIAPGEYKLFAWEDLENDIYYDPEFLKRFEKLGQQISISENDKQTARLNLIPAGG